MTESREIYDQNRIDFLHRVQAVKSEIRTKFQNLRHTIDNHELTTLEKVEEIQHEILENYERALTSLKEISQVRDQVLTGLKSNTTNDFLRKNLEMYDREIEAVEKNSKIDSIFELVWCTEHLDLFDLCKVVSYSRNPLLQEAPVPMSSDHSHEESPTLFSPQMLPQSADGDMLQPAFPSNKLVKPDFSKAPPNSFFSKSPLFSALKAPPNSIFSKSPFLTGLKAPPSNQKFSKSTPSTALPNQTLSQKSPFDSYIGRLYSSTNCAKGNKSYRPSKSSKRRRGKKLF